MLTKMQAHARAEAALSVRNRGTETDDSPAAGERHRHRRPDVEHPLMREEAAEDRSAFPLRKATGKDGEESVPLDQGVKEIDH